MFHKAAETTPALWNIRRLTAMRARASGPEQLAAADESPDVSAAITCIPQLMATSLPFGFAGGDLHPIQVQRDGEVARLVLPEALEPLAASLPT